MLPRDADWRKRNTKHQLGSIMLNDLRPEEVRMDSEAPNAFEKNRFLNNKYMTLTEISRHSKINHKIVEERMKKEAQ